MAEDHRAEEDTGQRFPGVHWVRWNHAAAERYPELEQAIERFDPGPRPAAQASATWLREQGLNGESIPYLLIEDGKLLGFYALTAGQVELSGGHRKRLGLARPTQGAVLLTQLAKSAAHEVDGGRLVEDAIGVASELAQRMGATVLAVDPFDEATDQMWQKRFQLRPSRTAVPGHPELKRLYAPL
ncbi:hypothetical protein OJ997_21535 [Solirubrobacter phytolaccae]|uniref:Uncharacterized protein n=1 Tax=Solirubrobacter phytolaccae TaxID=1404360 RepID=A0A9X3NB81_9ACTN|nr:hypothetical protein [Solirubrobacter phytolaccae]MDA0182909.1 hypothetical protein [Solirubrobacter phytolaccae]